ncbi:dTDP-glucose pyrophosphorylase [Aeropyrum camini SY1 = JCM 12091]|uniref:dTDP-glucose pyrophosphorylase n=1 Tax=Aeropyrum camini SY1 = JCM 12091 TaxID=1198449 RepID=U3TE73_9CREN|nr:dTDP-glucose pyrophosphorylase [Aeropyrum camini SY1 = JCM 12091]
MACCLCKYTTSFTKLSAASNGRMVEGRGWGWLDGGIHIHASTDFAPYEGEADLARNPTPQEVLSTLGSLTGKPLLRLERAL